MEEKKLEKQLRLPAGLFSLSVSLFPSRGFQTQGAAAAAAAAAVGELYNSFAATCRGDGRLMDLPPPLSLLPITGRQITARFSGSINAY